MQRHRDFVNPKIDIIINQDGTQERQNVGKNEKKKKKSQKMEQEGLVTNQLAVTGDKRKAKETKAKFRKITL